MTLKTNLFLSTLIALFALCAKADTLPTDSMPCATLMYSLPGAEYMHKLVVRNGCQVTDVDFSNIKSLRLYSDRQSVGNRYKYVRGIAPQEEGEYTYTVKILNENLQPRAIEVKLIVSNHLQSPTPMMSWLTWNWFAREISHAKMVEIAKGLKSTGLIDAGFRTIVLDDAWAVPTDVKADLTYDPQKFPEGILGLKHALQQIDSRLLLGIYSDAGTQTCENYQPGSYLYETQHLALFDSWDVDMLKYDFCNSEASSVESYTRMGDAVKALNQMRQANGLRPFVLNICEWGKTDPWLWAAKAGGSSWRSTSDAREDWIGDESLPGVIGGADVVRRLWMYTGVNRYNDLDMMCIGLHGLGGPSNYIVSHTQNGGTITGLTPMQARTQMSLWSMFASPLALTCDLRSTPQGEANAGAQMPDTLITFSDLSILTNREIIAINQDALGQQAEYMEQLSTGSTNFSPLGYDVYLKDLTHNRIAVSITNRSSEPLPSITLPLASLYLNPHKKYHSRNLWSAQTTTIKTTLTTAPLAPHETQVFIIYK